MTNDLFAEKTYYFRNALVRANYENAFQGVEKTQLPLEEFFKVLLFGCDIELRNRFLEIGQEYGTPDGEAIKNLHRRNANANGVLNRHDVGINVGIKFTNQEESAMKAILRNPRTTASMLGRILGMSARNAERIIASLKEKANLRHFFRQDLQD